MTRLVLLLSFAIAAPLLAGPTTGLPPLPWPVPDEHAPPKVGGHERMVPLQPLVAPATLIPPPLLYIRIDGPKGSQIALQRNGARESHVLPALIGFRPGYQYRLELSNLPGRPGVTYYPTLEVRGSVALNYKLRPADFPAFLVFRDVDFEKVADGTLVQKIVVLERPEFAVPQQSGPNMPIELAVAAGADAFTEARERGLPLAFVFLGQRSFDAQEMEVVPGTVYLPGDKTLPMPSAPPTIPWTCYPLVDPKLGTIHPSEYVSVYDGGDSNTPAGFDARGRLRGVDPSDTVAEYTNSKGAKRLAISNRVALCIPRYILIRHESTPILRGTVYGPEIAKAEKTPVVIESHQQLVERIQKLQLEVARQTAKPSIIENVYGTKVTAAIKNTRIAVSIQTPETLNGAKIPNAEAADGPLLICKWPDKMGANIGDTIMFSLKYVNTGKQPMSNVVVIDNLTPRFEYIPGTAKTDRDATFTFQPNQTGSHILRWELAAELPPGETGLITFEVRVR